MAIDARIRELDTRHQTLDRKIEDELRHHADPLRVSELKKQKLRLKDQLEQMRPH